MIFDREYYPWGPITRPVARPLNIPGKLALTQSTNNLASYIWSLADLLRGDFKQSQYGRIILPFTLLRRLECVMQPSKAAVLAEAQRLAGSGLPEEAQEKMLLRASALSFYNT